MPGHSDHTVDRHSPVGGICVVLLLLMSNRSRPNTMFHSDRVTTQYNTGAHFHHQNHIIGCSHQMLMRCVRKWRMANGEHVKIITITRRCKLILYLWHIIACLTKSKRNGRNGTISYCIGFCTLHTNQYIYTRCAYASGIGTITYPIGTFSQLFCTITRKHRQSINTSCFVVCRDI